MNTQIIDLDDDLTAYIPVREAPQINHKSPGPDSQILLEINGVTLSEATLDSHVPKPTALPPLKNEITWEALAQSKAWLALLHWGNSLWSHQSTIDDPKFFIHPKGKWNPFLELTATFEHLERIRRDADKPREPYFLARYVFILQHLKVSNWSVPSYDEKLKEFDDFPSPKFSLVFPAAYLSSPASMFGHTFLMLQTSNKSRRLNRCINYAAKTGESNGLFFAIHGVFGLYQGYYSVLPYFDKIREYTNMDQRDIWEYDLDLSEAECRMLLYHVSELNDIRSDYFFFKENCSYNILALLNATKPESDLMKDFRFGAMPIDTIQTLHKAKLIQVARYRPSAAAIIQHLYQQLSAPVQAESLNFVRSDEPIKSLLTPKQTALVYELSGQILSSDLSQGLTDQPSYSKKYLDLLQKRSKLGVVDIDRSPPAPEQPQLGHEPRNIQWGYVHRNRKDFLKLSYRPCYHKVSDPPQGHLFGSSLAFFQNDFSVEKNGVHWEKFNALHLLTLTPHEPIFKKKSFGIDLSYSRQLDQEIQRNLSLDIRYGLSREISPRNTVYIMGLTNTGYRFQHQDHAMFRLGPQLGWLVVKPWGVLHGETDLQYDTFVNESVHHGSISLSHYKNKKFGLQQKFEWAKSAAKDWATSYELSLSAYF